MEIVKLRVCFVNTERELVRTIETECVLCRSCNMPYIIIKDNILLNILNVEDDDFQLNWYDYESDCFNFKCTVECLASSKCEPPEDIELNILELIDDDGYSTYVLLQPGLWTENSNGKRIRMCDDAKLHIIAHKFVPIDSRVNAYDSHEFVELFAKYDDSLVIPPVYVYADIDDDAWDNDDDEDDDDEMDDNDNVYSVLSHTNLCQVQTKDEILGDIDRYLRYFQPDYKLVKNEHISTVKARRVKRNHNK